MLLWRLLLRGLLGLLLWWGDPPTTAWGHRGGATPNHTVWALLGRCSAVQCSVQCSVKCVPGGAI